MYQRAVGTKNEKSISEAARLLDRGEYDTSISTSFDDAVTLFKPY